MSMAATFNKNEVTEKVYPYVGEMNLAQGHICVLFVRSNSGCVLINTMPLVCLYQVGHFETTWSENNFTPVEATIQFGV